MLGWARTRFGLLALLGPLLFAAGDGALAQGNLFDRAKDAVGDYGISVPGADALGSDEIAAGLREALKVGSERVVQQVGARDGFNGDPQIHIPLPGALQRLHDCFRYRHPAELIGPAADRQRGTGETLPAQPVEIRGPGCRVQAGNKQDFRAEVIADAGQECLIEIQRGDIATMEAL